MGSANKIIARTVLSFGIIFFIHVCSGIGNPNNTSHPYPKKYCSESSPPNPPRIFPNASLNEMDPPVIDYNNSIFNSTKLCWPDVAKAYWGTVLHHDPKYTGKHHQKLRARFRELNDIFVDHIRMMILTSDEIRGLLYYNSTQEEIMEAKNKTNAQESAATSQKKENITAEGSKNCSCSQNRATDSGNNNTNTEVLQDDSTRSITVPMLLIVILVLLTYIAFLYRKLQFARYKDAQILVQDELIDPWATR
ncbi:uncharacterized protein LOC135848489 [Planococcus citri]|uniref:uncharacterized protein LOC135848489 n=1 Tax=Planococcus citri TaxID=170843 RepID=UPI0031F8F9B0